MRKPASEHLPTFRIGPSNFPRGVSIPREVRNISLTFTTISTRSTNMRNSWTSQTHAEMSSEGVFVQVTRRRSPGARARGPRRSAARRRHGTITLSEARSRLHQRQFSRPNTHFAAFFKICKRSIFSHANLQNLFKISQNFAKF